jgi:hypothetical protein
MLMIPRQLLRTSFYAGAFGFKTQFCQIYMFLRLYAEGRLLGSFGFKEIEPHLTMKKHT